MLVELRDLGAADIATMAEQVREMDRFEFDVMSGGKTVRECLDHLARRSRRARAAYADGRLVALYGVLTQTILSDEGHPWLCATAAIEDPETRRAFIAHSIPELLWVGGDLSLLWNLVYAGNRISIRWLKWMGFEFEDAPYMVRGHEFLRFKMGD